jgi:phytoene dehydrogenase-like protein
MNPPIVIGAGHNGLVAAFYLAKAGLKPVVLESREVVGGGAITGQLHTGFRCPTLSHTAAIRADIAAEMNLRSHGVETLTPACTVFAPGVDNRGIALFEDVGRTGDAIREFNQRDAERYAAYRASVAEVSSVLAPLLDSVPPDIERPSSSDLWRLLKAGRRFRALGRKNAYRLLRWLPMAVSDFVGEWFESELLRAALAAPALSGRVNGLASVDGRVVVLVRDANYKLMDATGQVGGGRGALTQALAAAARAAGAEIRASTRVDTICVARNRVTGVVAGGREIPAEVVVSAVDPRTTFLELVDPMDLAPDFITKIRNYRSRGTVAKVNLALSALPSFTAAAGDPTKLSGRIHIGPELDYLERAFDHAKYGELSEHPWLDVRIPSVLDPSLAPPGAHVMSIYAQYAPPCLRGTAWSAERETGGERVLRALEPYAPRISELVVARQVITPAELQDEYGFSGGHIFHGELALDQLFTMRPLLGHARYATPIEGLYLCSAGTHPGGMMSGASGRLAADQVIRSLV